MRPRRGSRIIALCCAAAETPERVGTFNVQIPLA